MSEAALSNALLLAALLAGLAGMGWLALSLPVHAQQACGRTLSAGNARALRWLGAVALAVALALCLRADHASMAVLVWVMVMAFSALTVAMSLAWCPRALRLIAPWLAASG